tara:strand:- start:930 stop:1532 length:603 start_codon:yes stop_codon:yes gene_type:complete
MAEPASDSQMAEEANYLPKDPARRQQRLEEFRDRLYSLVQESPDSIRAAHVYFNRGLTTAELQLLMDEHQLEVIDANLKAPQGNNGVVMSLGLGYAGVLASDGDLSDRLSFAIDAHQACFVKMAKYVSDEEVHEWEGLSTVTFLVYSASIFGSATALQQLQESPDVTSIVLIFREGLIEEFQKQKKTNGPNVYKMPGFLC